MNNLQQILTLAATCLPLLAGLLTFLLKFVKNAKAKRILEHSIKLTQNLQPLIMQAEQFTHYSGEEKKNYVITRANRFAIENGMSFDENRVSVIIDEILETTKRVNARAKDKSNTNENAVII